MIKLRKKKKLYEGFLTFSSTSKLKDLNLLVEYYKLKLKNWGSGKNTSKIYFLESKTPKSFNKEKSIIFCLKIIFDLDPKNLYLFNKLIKLNQKVKKVLILSKKSYGSTQKTSIKSKK
jgi:hypothetical protein